MNGAGHRSMRTPCRDRAFLTLGCDLLRVGPHVMCSQVRIFTSLGI